MRETRTQLLVAGGGLGGVAAALAACARGVDVVLTEEHAWLGGQLTSQAVPPDEHPWIERFGCTARYRGLRDAIRAYYRRHYPLTEAARARRALNPGASFVSALAHEPRVAVAAIDIVSGHGRVGWADWVLDATETGELLPLCGAEYVPGSEARADTGEP